MKIIYCDFDGVLVTKKSIIRAMEENLDLDQCLCPYAVENLNYILSVESGIRIVVSSAWRLQRTLQELRDILARSGLSFPQRIVSLTPVLPEQTRSDEILAWLSENGQTVKAFAILDDLPMRNDLAKFLVQTNPAIGLTWTDAEKVLKILNAG